MNNDNEINIHLCNYIIYLIFYECVTVCLYEKMSNFIWQHESNKAFVIVEIKINEKILLYTQISQIK